MASSPFSWLSFLFGPHYGFLLFGNIVHVVEVARGRWEPANFSGYYREPTAGKQWSLQNPLNQKGRE